MHIVSSFEVAAWECLGRRWTADEVGYFERLLYQKILSSHYRRHENMPFSDYGDEMRYNMYGCPYTTPPLSTWARLAPTERK